MYIIITIYMQAKYQFAYSYLKDKTIGETIGEFKQSECNQTYHISSVNQ